MTLVDISSENIPRLVKIVRKPCNLLVQEVILKHKSTNPPAKFGHDIKETDGLDHFQESRSVHFDKATRSYRVQEANPILGNAYQLRWEIDQIPST